MFYWRAIQQLDHRPHQVVGNAEQDTLKARRKGDYQRRDGGDTKNDQGGRAVGLQL
jgi:hypothetical protein